MKQYRVITSIGTSYVVTAEEIQVEGDYIVLVTDPRASVTPVAVILTPVMVYEVSQVTHDPQEKV